MAEIRGGYIQQHINIKLTPQSHLRAVQAAKATGRPRGRTMFMLVADYLKDRRRDIWEQLNDPEFLKHDEYWGTARELSEPRPLPKYLVRADAEVQAERVRALQQKVDNHELFLMKSWARYFGVTMNDLAEAAIQSFAAGMKWDKTPDLIGRPKGEK